MLDINLQERSEKWVWEVYVKGCQKKTIQAKKIIYDGKDPLEIKKERQLEKKKKIITFQKICDEFIKDFQVGSLIKNIYNNGQIL